MQLQFRFFGGGDFNPYENDEKEAFKRLDKERLVKDPEKQLPLWEVFPTLDSYPDFVIARSKSVFWKYEKDLALDPDGNSILIEDMWKDAMRRREVGEFLLKIDGDESTKAICYYMAVDFHRTNPLDQSVDFRLYFTEKGIYGGEHHTLEAYEG